MGGEPALAKGERWPMSAGQRLQFLMQLDLSTLPTQRESGLLQVFGGQVRVVHGPVWRRATPRGVHETPEWPIVGGTRSRIFRTRENTTAWVFATEWMP